jgi:diacylglycerol kinase (ATP)
MSKNVVCYFYKAKMELESRRNKKHKLFTSIRFAFYGIWKAIKKERNIKIHLGAMVLAIIMGLVLKISMLEWVVLVVLFGMVIGGEIFNSALEATADLVRDRLELDYYETYWVRNLSAGGVMVFALAALIVGLLIFLPRIF